MHYDLPLPLPDTIVVDGVTYRHDGSPPRAPSQIGDNHVARYCATAALGCNLVLTCNQVTAVTNGQAHYKKSWRAGAWGLSTDGTGFEVMSAQHATAEEAHRQLIKVLKPTSAILRAVHMTAHNLALQVFLSGDEPDCG